MVEIRKMSLKDLQIALGWAALEGWNPGLEDVDAFYRADPDGFLMAWDGDTPVAAISAVRNGNDYGFIGLYICRPEYRGKGFGWDIWLKGMERLEGRTIGLDGVPDQQENYRKSGFELSHNTARYGGVIAGAVDSGLTLTSADMTDELVAFDKGLSGIQRGQYASAWFENTDTRKTYVGNTDGKITSVGTIRTCREGHKIGPLYAPNKDQALDLLKALVHEMSAKMVFVDVPQINFPAVELMTSLGMEPTFQTARMYKGVRPVQQDNLIFGVVTLELG